MSTSPGNPIEHFRQKCFRLVLLDESSATCCCKLSLRDACASREVPRRGDCGRYKGPEGGCCAACMMMPPPPSAKCPPGGGGSQSSSSSSSRGWSSSGGIIRTSEVLGALSFVGQGCLPARPRKARGSPLTLWFGRHRCSWTSFCDLDLFCFGDLLSLSLSLRAPPPALCSSPSWIEQQCRRRQWLLGVGCLFVGCGNGREGRNQSQ